MKKSLVLTTSNAFGTNNYVLGLIFVIFGGLSYLMLGIMLIFGFFKGIKRKFKVSPKEDIGTW